MFDPSVLEAANTAVNSTKTPDDFFSKFVGGIGELGAGIFDAVKGAVPVFAEKVLQDSIKNPDKANTFKEISVPVQGGISTNPAATNQGAIVLDIKTIALIGAGLLAGFILLKN